MRSREDFNGRWHDALWIVTEFGTPDYAATAARIWTHLEENERKITGKERSETEQTGLAAARGAHISKSVRDARSPKRAGHSRDESWTEKSVRIYFGIV
jgi:hypothetical protein